MVVKDIAKVGKAWANKKVIATPQTAVSDFFIKQDFRRSETRMEMDIKLHYPG